MCVRSRPTSIQLFFISIILPTFFSPSSTSLELFKKYIFFILKILFTMLGQLLCASVCAVRRLRSVMGETVLIIKKTHQRFSVYSTEILFRHSRNKILSKNQTAYQLILSEIVQASNWIGLFLLLLFSHTLPISPKRARECECERESTCRYRTGAIEREEMKRELFCVL